MEKMKKVMYCTAAVLFLCFVAYAGFVWWKRTKLRLDNKNVPATVSPSTATNNCGGI